MNLCFSESLRKLNHQSGHLLIFSSLSLWHLLFSTWEKRIGARSCLFKLGSIMKYEEVQCSSACLIAVTFCNKRYRIIVEVISFIVSDDILSKAKLLNLNSETCIWICIRHVCALFRSDSKMPSLNQMGSQNGIFSITLETKRDTIRP